jgi:ketosteroid isomerase-like protein
MPRAVGCLAGQSDVTDAPWPGGGNDAFMPSNREIVAGAFAAWMNGTGYVTSIFADDMAWEITGRSAASRKYANTSRFVDEVLHPFAARFGTGDPFRPVAIQAVYNDEEQGTVVVIWDGRGTTTAGTVYENTYAWIMTLRDGRVIDGTAFYDSIAFNELWATVAISA